jgi:hypothetical protein
VPYDCLLPNADCLVLPTADCRAPNTFALIASEWELTLCSPYPQSITPPVIVIVVLYVSGPLAHGVGHLLRKSGGRPPLTA